MTNQVLLLHGATETCGYNVKRGNSSMARKRNSFRSYYDKSLGTRVKRRVRSGRGLSGLGASRMETTKQIFDSVKGVLKVGAIAAGGAIVTDSVFAYFSSKYTMSNVTKGLAKMGTGIVLGLFIAKFTKKVDIGVAFAIGPIVTGTRDMLKELKVLGGLAGMDGIVDISMPGEKFALTKAPFGGLNGSRGLSGQGWTGRGIPSEFIQASPDFVYAA